MADLNKLFPGFESFMDGDIEINNEVTVPESDDTTAESVADEVESEEIATEGAEIEGEATENETAAEATNMMFDQLLMMYRHVKRFGIDRTFLSLYNDKGQLNNMIGYRFPSCESIDSVGSPRSQMSAAFIAAMEDDQGGVFKRIWTWIVTQCKRVYNLVLRIIDWFKSKFINTGKRIEKLRALLHGATFKSSDELDDTYTVTDASAVLAVMKSPAAKDMQKGINECLADSKLSVKILKELSVRLKPDQNSDTSGLSQNVNESATTDIERGTDKLKNMVDALKKELSNAEGKSVGIKTLYKKLSSPNAVLKELDAIESTYKELAKVQTDIDQAGKNAKTLVDFTSKALASYNSKNWFMKANDTVALNTGDRSTLTGFHNSMSSEFERAKALCMKWTKQSTVLLTAVRIAENVQGSAINALAAYVSKVTK